MTGLQIKVENHLPELTAAMRQRASRLVQQTALQIEARAKIAIQSPPKSGRMCGAHRASAPGEAPATDTGALASSIQTERVSDLTAAVQVGTEYGEVLELGGAHLAPRPYLGPAAEAERAPFEQGVRGIITP